MIRFHLWRLMWSARLHRVAWRLGHRCDGPPF